MMKFKSLFRRGHAGPSSSNVKRHRGENSSGHIGASAVSNNNESSMRPAASVCSLDTKHHKIVSLTPQKRKPRTLTSAADVSSLKKMEEDTTIQTEHSSSEKSDLEEELFRCRCEIESLRMELSKLEKGQDSKVDAIVEGGSQTNLAPDCQKEQMECFSTAANLPAPSLPTQQQLLAETAETPDWDKHSSSSLSEVSVACLQDRIMQMEETHYSTNEELQATLQELADLQTQLTELQTDNERLGEEKGVLLESLCRQTERLEDARTKVDTLQGLLLENPAGCPASNSEREQKLVELLKSGQEERETLLLKQEELGNEVSELRRVGEMMRQESLRLAERVRLLESTVDATHAERNQLDLELARAKEESSSRQIEISRLTTLLDNARAKIDELEAARDKLGDKSELDELLDNARKEKDLLEVQAASLQEQLARSQCEVAKLKEQVSILQEECKVTRNNAKSALSDLEYECQKGREERGRLAADLQALQESSSELQVQSQCHLDDKRQLESLLTETQKHLGECARSLAYTEKLLVEEKNMRAKESEEWQQFQSDLLMTVRVANEFKTEAQHELERLVMENKQLRDKNRSLDEQLEKLKLAAAEKPQVVSESGNSATMLSLRCEVSQEMCRRHKISRQDSRLSVKSLIESIENATKQAKTGSGVSRSSSTSSLNSIASMTGASSGSTPASQQPLPLAPTPAPASLCDSEFKTPLPPLPLRDRDQQSAATKHHLKRTLLSDSLDKGSKSANTEDTTANILTSRGMEFSRRNSSNDLSERKDPLTALVKNGGSKRNALLKWCQNKTIGYHNIDITNFSSSWNDGMALCALLHSYLPDKVPYDSLVPSEKKRNFTIAFAAAESVGIPTSISITDMIQQERPDWQRVMAYITAIYKHFETA